MNTAEKWLTILAGLALSASISSCAQGQYGQPGSGSQPNYGYDQPGYPNQGNYPNRGNYPNQGSYNNGPGYGYNNQSGYGQQGSPNFYGELSPYGQWVQTPEYGAVWIPNAGADFQPYATNGHWVVTEYGNTWVSDYAWGWGPFHYGRWYQDRYRGWAWVPGNDWGPAWVSWRSGGGYYGWAPLGPGINVNINMPAPYWTFVPQMYITSPRLYSYCVPRPRVVNIYQNTTIINNVYRANNREYAYGPRREEIERVTRQRVPVYRIENAGRPGRDQVRGDAVGIYRPNEVRASRGDGRYDANSNGGRGSTPVYSNPNAGTYPDGNARGGAGAYPGNNPTPSPSATYPGNSRGDSRGSGGAYPGRGSRGDSRGSGSYSGETPASTPPDAPPSYPQRGGWSRSNGNRGGTDATPTQPQQQAPQQNQPYSPQPDRQPQQSFPQQGGAGRRGGGGYSQPEAPAQASPQPQAQPQRGGGFEQQAQPQPQPRQQEQRGGDEQRGQGGQPQPQGGGRGSRGPR